MTAALIALASFPLAWWWVDVVRRFALRAGVLDRPNERSSHHVPTPRGGGVGAIAATVTAAGLAATAIGIPPLVTAAGAIAVAAVAVVGWIDDRRTLAVAPRLAAHLLAATIVAALAWFSGAGAMLDRYVPEPIASALVAAWWAFWVVSSINIVNFMDGIDGLIGSQMFVLGIYAASLAPPPQPAGLLGLALSGGALGFLRWNWAPARIFLGDVGSGAYGVILALTGLALVAGDDISIVRAFLPLFPLYLDATVTLVRRAARGERVTEAHRQHLYQRLSAGPWSHATTSLAYAALAALGGVIGVTAPRGAMFTMLVFAYAAAVAAVGYLLDRRAPLVRPVHA